MAPASGAQPAPHVVGGLVLADVRLPLQSRSFGAVATRTIAAGDALVCVPREALLTPRRARECAACGAAAAQLSDWQALALKLLHERALGGASAWAPYVAVLPPQPCDADDAASYDHPLLWPPGLAEELLAGSLMLVRCPAV